jgi:hypothetical protein
LLNDHAMGKYGYKLTEVFNKIRLLLSQFPRKSYLLNNLYPEFHENPANGLVADITSQRDTDGGTDLRGTFHTNAAFTLQRKAECEYLN